MKTTWRRPLIASGAVLLGTIGIVVAGLFVVGQPVAATKVLLFASLLPATFLCGVLLVLGLSSAGSTLEDRPSAIVGLAGLTLFGAMFVLWIPIAPDRWTWRWDEMPELLSVPMLIGLLLLSVASAGWLIGEFARSVRARDYGRAAGTLAAILVIGWMAAEAVSRSIS